MYGGIFYQQGPRGVQLRVPRSLEIGIVQSRDAVGALHSSPILEHVKEVIGANQGTANP